MEIDLESAFAVLGRTPDVLRAMLEGIPEELEQGSEGEETWSPYDILGHLVHGERTDWIPRLRIILEHGETQAFEPFDRFAQYEESRGKSLEDLLAEFEGLRAKNLEILEELELEPADFGRTGLHPDLGVVSLGELLSTWVVHDLGHIAQIGRVMAKQLDAKVGPWRAYLPILAPRHPS
jgi:hypothetical protein